MKYLICLLLFIFCFSSCAIVFTWFRPKGFTFRYNGEYTRLDSLINIDGYYYSDSTHHTVLFYRDGSVAQMYGYSEKEYFDKKNKEKYKYVTHWGIYRLVSDTIKAQFVLSLGGQETMKTDHYNFIIKSKDEMEYNIEGYFMNDSITPWDRIFIDDTVKISLKYHSYPNRMDSAHWVKKRKWFWDKEAYKKREKEK